ncbi:hypothetical protein [Sporosarcina sp. Marseille-Q4943]|uniref:hypothetical protein n=1 Tax=Sporosarcina sp. Marseille-Q4943 TaxID=2942204 RepID=UPI00208DD0D8|nr:hypothetical protein [Sporosarcina sp. Marseille-Q4943]
MGKSVITAVISRHSGIMDILRTNMDSSIKEQVLRQLESLEGVPVNRVVIETEIKHYIIKVGVEE